MLPVSPLDLVHVFSTFGCYRWKRDENRSVVYRAGKPVLQFIAIRRQENGEWAIPGVSYQLFHHCIPFCSSIVISAFRQNVAGSNLERAY